MEKMSANKSKFKVSNKSVPNLSNIITNTMSKLRRLQIQENLLRKSIESCLSQNNLEDEQFINNLFTSNTSKNIAKTQNKFIEIRNLFQEVKLNANAPNADIAEIKKDISDLEMKIKMQKLSLQSELAALKKSENEISQQLDENHVCRNDQTDKLKKKIKTFDDIVPSPVKNIINSPMKRCEIQEFQEFLASHKRHGGWIEYHHNKFVRLWKKHVENLPETDSQEDIFKTKQFQKFLKELLATIPDVTLDAVLEHSQWYFTFITLKNRQQKVLNEWKRKKNILKQTHSKRNEALPDASRNAAEIENTNLRGSAQSNKTESLVSPNGCQSPPSCNSSMDLSSCSYSMSCSSSINSKESSRGYLRPTKQWTSKCFSHEAVDKWNQTSRPTEIQKLRVPIWRNTLMK